MRLCSVSPRLTVSAIASIARPSIERKVARSTSACELPRQCFSVRPVRRAHHPDTERPTRYARRFPGQVYPETTIVFARSSRSNFPSFRSVANLGEGQMVIVFPRHLYSFLSPQDWLLKVFHFGFRSRINRPQRISTRHALSNFCY